MTSQQQADRLIGFWDRVDSDTDPTGCWPWSGPVNAAGYGHVGFAGKTWIVHRLAYFLLVGPIPDGLTIDHVAARGCTTKRCCNPDHMEPVTVPENLARAKAHRDRCPQGHEYDGKNVRGARTCSPCTRAAGRRYRQRRATLSA